jgi:hypothetical protein
VGDTQLNEDRFTVTDVNRIFKLKAIYDVKLDSVNSIKFAASTNFIIQKVMNLQMEPQLEMAEY